jgi:hypothetical protein
LQRLAIAFDLMDPPARPAPPASPDAPRRAVARDPLTDAIARRRLGTMAADEAMSIPAVRKAVATISGTLSTFALRLWTDAGMQTGPGVPGWLSQPVDGRTLQYVLKHTVDDLIWHDRAYWQVTARYTETLRPSRFRYIAADRVLAIHDPRDVDAAPAAHWIDGVEVPSSQPLVVFDAAGLGGLRLYGWAMLDLYVRLMEAAGRYADSPLPSMALHNTGADLDPDEVAQLLAAWETARQARSTAYLNSVVKAEAFGWSARELQLTEAREHAAQEVARLFALPAFAVNAADASPMTYANVVDRRRDLIEALRPWVTVIDQTLSLPPITPSTQQVRMDVAAYTRDDPSTRMTTWATGISAGVLTVDEARAAEPLATGSQTL